MVTGYSLLAENKEHAVGLIALTFYSKREVFDCRESTLRLELVG